MKIPRDCNATELVRALRHLGYETQRQTGSHLQITTQRAGEHHVSVPNHRPMTRMKSAGARLTLGRSGLDGDGRCSLIVGSVSIWPELRRAAERLARTPTGRAR